MAEVCAINGFKTGVEVGVKEGRFTHYLVTTIPGLYMYSVDKWEKCSNETEDYSGWPMEEYERNFRLAVKSLPVMILKMDSLKAAGVIPSVDFVFIDADHSYKGVKADIDAYRKKCRFLCGHDYHMEGVKKAVDEIGIPEVGPNNVWALWM